MALGRPIYQDQLARWESGPAALRVFVNSDAFEREAGGWNRVSGVANCGSVDAR